MLAKLEALVFKGGEVGVPLAEKRTLEYVNFLKREHPDLAKKAGEDSIRKVSASPQSSTLYSLGSNR